MAEPTYESVAADIVKVSAAGDDLATQQMVSNFCQVFTEFLVDYTRRTNGYMAMAAFVVAFTEMKKVIAAARPEDKKLIEETVKAVIGSFGHMVN